MHTSLVDRTQTARFGGRFTRRRKLAGDDGRFVRLYLQELNKRRSPSVASTPRTSPSSSTTATTST
jgi:hypothetical protein